MSYIYLYILTLSYPAFNRENSDSKMLQSQKEREKRDDSIYKINLNVT